MPLKSSPKIIIYVTFLAFYVHSFPLVQKGWYCLKVLLNCAIFRTTCLVTPLRNKLHETLHNVTYLATGQKTLQKVKLSSTFRNGSGNVAKTFSNFAQRNICPAACVAPVCSTSKRKSCDHRKRDKLQETLLSVTPVK